LICTGIISPPEPRASTEEVSKLASWGSCKMKFHTVGGKTRRLIRWLCTVSMTWTGSNLAMVTVQQPR